MTYYILDHRNIPQIATEIEYNAWYAAAGHSKRIIKQTEIGDAFISTVFLGMDISTSFNSVPELFENYLSIEKYEHTEIARFPLCPTAMEYHWKMVGKAMLAYMNLIKLN